MKPFITQLTIQFKNDLRDKSVLMVYYVVPLIFYIVMGNIMQTLEMGTKSSITMSITIFALSMSSYLGMPQILVKARENGVLQAYRVAGIPSWSLPLTTIIISLLHIMIVTVIIVFTTPFLFDSPLSGNIGLYFLSIFIIALCSSALGTLISCFVKKQSTLTLVGQLFFMPTILLSGIMFPANVLPRTMQYIGEILPATQGLKLFFDNTIHLQPLIILFAVTIIAFTVSALLFRKISTKQ